jgi:hypothetical protein
MSQPRHRHPDGVGQLSRRRPTRGDVLLSYVEEDISEDELVSGLIGLAGILLVQLEKATGRPAAELMTDLARRYMT